MNFILSLPLSPSLSPPTASLTLSLMVEAPFSPLSLTVSTPALSAALGAESPLAMFLTVLPVAPDILLLRPSSRSVTTKATPRSAKADAKPCSCSPSWFKPVGLRDSPPSLSSCTGTGSSHISLSFDPLARHSVGAAGIELLALRAPRLGLRRAPRIRRWVLRLLRPLACIRRWVLRLLRPLALRIRRWALRLLRRPALRIRRWALRLRRCLLLRIRLGVHQLSSVSSSS